MSAQKLRTRGWTFTINNDTFEDLIGLIETDFEYLVIGFEVGDSGTPHIQGYIYFKNPRMLKGVRKFDATGTPFSFKRNCSSKSQIL